MRCKVRYNRIKGENYINEVVEAEVKISDEEEFVLHLS